MRFRYVIHMFSIEEPVPTTVLENFFSFFFVNACGREEKVVGWRGDL